jgi:hypothetical protein
VLGNLEPACAGRQDRHVRARPKEIELLTDDRRLLGSAQPL